VREREREREIERERERERERGGGRVSNRKTMDGLNSFYHLLVSNVLRCFSLGLQWLQNSR
jgi:hypothetical protein